MMIILLAAIKFSSIVCTYNKGRTSKVCVKAIILSKTIEHISSFQHTWHIYMLFGYIQFDP